MTILAEKRSILGRIYIYALRLETASVIRIVTEFGRVWHSTVRTRSVNKFKYRINVGEP